MPRSPATATATILASLMLAYGQFGGEQARADFFDIPDGDVSALVDAIAISNINSSADVIRLAQGGTYVVDTIASSLGGGSAFPLIEPDDESGLQILGNGATIRRDQAAPPMRFFTVLDGAYLFLINLTLSGGLAEHIEGGGAISVRGVAEVEQTIIENNKAPNGSAIRAAGVLLIRDSEIRNNSSDKSAAAIVANSLFVFDSTIRDNRGGGILIADSIDIRNSTITDNHGFGIHVLESSDSTSISGVTVSNNSTSGLVVDAIEPFHTYVSNSVLTQNTENCSIAGQNSGTNNISDDSSCPPDEGFTIVVDTLLEDLADNGGLTLPDGSAPRTMIPRHGSPLVDSGDQDTCNSTAFRDQRDKPRTVDGDADDVPICDVGSAEYQLLQPYSLDVDTMPLESDGNGVLEPDEMTWIQPTWSYVGQPISGEVFGRAGDFEGPPGGSYTVHKETTDYGTPMPDEPFSCQPPGPKSCYSVTSQMYGERPRQHWDAILTEDVKSPETEFFTTHRWSLHVGDSFSDVPRTNPFYRSIETLLHRGTTAGCDASNYCPGASIARQQIPVLVLKAAEGAGYLPPRCERDAEIFADVPAASPFCPWVEEFAARGIAAGCGDENYCPTDPASRAQMAVFMIRALEGSGYEPPPCESGTEEFDDVPASSLFCPWIEELARREVISGCNADNYCPGATVSRGQMSVFVAKTFGLELYGP